MNRFKQVKAKLDTAGLFASAVEHKLSNPKVKVLLSGEANVFQRAPATKFGFGKNFEVF